MNKLHFFIDEVSGVLKVITDMPEEPEYSDNDNVLLDQDNIVQYQSALKAAKRDAIEVDNPNDLPLIWVTTDTTTYFWKGEKMEVGSIYSLEGCKMELRTIQRHPNPDIWEKVAYITFSESKPKFCDGTFYCSLDATYNSDGTCAECGKIKRDKPMNEEKYFCKDCNCEINHGEFSTFGVCDNCWDKAYQSKTKSIPPLPVEDKEELIAELKDALTEYYELHNRMIESKLMNPAVGSPVRIKAKRLLEKLNS